MLSNRVVLGKAARRVVAGLLLAGVMLASAAEAQLRIEIERGVERPVPVAIVPFAWEGSGETAPFDLAELVSTNLRNSGRFDPIEHRDMLSMPTRPEQVNIQDWRIVNVDVLVIGRLLEDGPDRYTTVFQVFDVLRGEQIMGFRLSSTGADLRATGHRISDMIFEELTGIAGVFGTRIAYVAEQRDESGSTYHLIVSDADGENARVVTESRQPLMSPAWSPDGRRLAYVSFEDDHAAIYVQTLRTGSRERVSARAGVNNAPAWSPDGRRLALTLSQADGQLDIYVLDLGTQALTRLTNTPAIDTEPVWSPDGGSVYFTSDRAGGPQIYRVAAQAGSRAERVTYDGTYNARARVSPDGTQLAVVHNDRGNFRIALVDIRTGVTQVVTNGSNDESPDFAPNGAAVIYATREGGRGMLASVSTDGRIRQQIASVEGQVREPVWGPFPLP